MEALYGIEMTSADGTGFTAWYVADLTLADMVGDAL